MSGQGLLLSMGALRCCWIGANLAISFMEAPVKFLAPLPSRRGLVDVGRHVFSALNKVEVVLATFDLLGWYFLIQRGLVPTASSGGSNASFFSKLQLGHLLRMTPGLVVYLCQSFAYLPVMRSIGTEYVEGRSISSAKTHGIYVLFEVIKMSTLVMGTASIAHALLA
ncbi:hypothetical protein BGW38_009916 [Lunasporangiospora selenospora]|uniref:Uncharacterized protein n=1 Tax=Lunasporangiospora selenospora TaxID=979761 RepID=A0A9P6G2Y7_9FUNG|nr:hypothetical protein BGW38_009916 [Lunasporangiospora selenospora]